MVIYVDVLIFINFIIDYLLLKLVSKLLKCSAKMWRFLLAAFVSSLFSLYIFLPQQSFLIELLLRLLCSVVTVLICFGLKNIKYYLRTLSLFYAVSFIFAGVIMCLQMIRPSDNVSVNNGVVYFDISPVLLIVLSFVIYLVIALIKKLTSKTAENADRYTVELTFGERMVKTDAIADSGHSLKDAFGDSLMLLIDKKTAAELFGDTEVETMLALIPPGSEQLKRRFRLVPLKTVSGEKMLPGVKIDHIKIFDRENTAFDHPVAVISNEKLGDDFSAIIPML